MKRILIGFVVLLVGLGFLWGTWAALDSTLEFRKTAVAAEGTVIDFTTHQSDGKTMYTPKIQFATADGREIEFSSSSSSSSPGYDRGDKVKILYSKETPERARIDGFMDNWFLPILLGFFGLIFTLIGVGAIKSGFNQRRVDAWLAQHGMKVRAKLLGPELNTSYSVNGRHPWRLRAQWQHPVTQKVYVFYSDNLWFDPTDYCTVDAVDAVVNADDPREYRLDTTFLPQQA